MFKAIKKLLDGKRLVSETNTMSYQQKFREISNELNGSLDLNDWKELFKKLTFWEMQLELSDQNMTEIFNMQKEEANQLFSKFIDKQYIDILEEKKHLQSHNLLSTELFPKLKSNSYFLIVIDNLRYDQWITIKPLIEELFTIENEDIYSILKQ